VDGADASSEIVFGVSEFVAVLNQTLEYAYPNVVVTGELANFRVSKNRWVYFDIKDDAASVRCFGTIYQLPGPLEDGMLVRVRAVPRLHPLYGFSLNVLQVRPAGEGSIKKAAQLLERQLAAEGLFAPERKRPLPYPPAHIGLITSGESAAFRDFIKVAGARWGGMRITLIDVQVQGDAAPAQVAAAIAQANQLADAPDVLVVTRGGGSAEDLQAFSTERVTRAVAGSRIPTLVAIGHEVDMSLAERAADQRASTPSNAAELLTPDRRAVLAGLRMQTERLAHLAESSLAGARRDLTRASQQLADSVQAQLRQTRQALDLRRQVLQAFDPQAALRRGYALVRKDGQVVRAAGGLSQGDIIAIQLAGGHISASVISTK